MRGARFHSDPVPPVAAACTLACENAQLERTLRRDVVRFCQLLHDKNYLAANDGNVSVRLCPHRILITPTGVPKAFLAPEDLVIVDGTGKLLEGNSRPSGELPMHLAVLRIRPEIQAVVHAHPPTSIALTLIKHLRLNDVLPEVILSVGRIQVVPYARPLTDELADAVGGAMQQTDAVIMERHGTVTVGVTLSDAYARTERIEHACHVLWLAHAIARPTPLPDHEARALLNQYDRSRNKTD